MASKKIIFLNTVRTPFGDVVKGEILTGTEFNKKSSVKPKPNEKRKLISMPGFIFNFYEKKDPKRFLDKTVEETFFIPKTAFGEKGTIREVRASDLTRPTNSSTSTTSTTVTNESYLPIQTAQKPNKIVSFVVGTLAGVIVGYVVLKKLGK